MSDNRLDSDWTYIWQQPRIGLAGSGIVSAIYSAISVYPKIEIVCFTVYTTKYMSTSGGNILSQKGFAIAGCVVQGNIA